ncbi:hypothetical protein VPHD260_0132 [Vibrio phage D260]
MFKDLWVWLVGLFSDPAKEQKEKSKLNMKNRFSYSASLAKKAKDARKSKDANQ